MNMIRASLGVAVLAGLGACTSYREPARPAPPAAWVAPTTAAAAFDPRWWRAFGEPELDALVEEALARNPGVEAAVQQVTVARARLRQALAAARPELSGDGSATWQRGRGGDGGASVSETGGASGDPSGGMSALALSADTDSWELSLGASWEPDLFGGSRLRRRAAGLEIGATEVEVQAVRLAVSAAVVRAWLLGTGLGHRIDALREALALTEYATHLTQRRFELGDVRRTDVEALRAEALVLRADLAGLETAQRQAALALDGLLGREPGTTALQLFDAPLPYLSAAPPVGLPADLLSRRPDLLAAVARAQSGGLLADAERRDALPRFTLGLLLGRLGANQGGIGFTSGFSRASASFVWPGLDVGRSRASIALADAQADAGFIEYRRLFAGALEEVSQALTRLNGLAHRIGRLDAAVAARERALRLAEVSFRLGEMDRLGRVTTQRDLLQARLTRLEALQAVGETRADLAVALGGGWTARGEPVP